MPVQEHHAGALSCGYILLNICITIRLAVRIQIGLAADEENTFSLGGTFAYFGDERKGKVIGDSAGLSCTPVKPGSGMGDVQCLKEQGLLEFVADVLIIAPVGIGGYAAVVKNVDKSPCREIYRTAGEQKFLFPGFVLCKGGSDAQSKDLRAVAKLSSNGNPGRWIVHGSGFGIFLNFF